jgi:ribonucleoside-diphosphate reductase alpha chain
MLRQDLYHARAHATGFKPTPYKERWDWDTLRQNIMKYGLRNSLHIAPMPTASTGKILGNVEAIEPLGSNIYVDSFLGGKIIVQCDQMVKHLIEIGQWSEQTYMKIKDGKGSIAKIETIPQHVRDIYKTVWEMPQTEIILRAANRQRYIDQAQSLNIHLNRNDDAVLKGVIKLGWQSMLPTGSYYIRTEAAGDAMRNDAVMQPPPVVANPLASSLEAVPPHASTKWGTVSHSGSTCDSCGS